METTDEHVAIGPWVRKVTPTIMSGRVVRWQRDDHDRREISASRDAIFIDAVASSDAALDQILAVLLAAQLEARAMAAADRFGRYQIDYALGAFDLMAHLRRQREFSERTFGPGPRTRGVTDHIRKELDEIERDPLDVKEWVDVILLALDGAWRAGHSPAQICDAIRAKQTRNENREWPDWRTADPNRAIEHLRDESAGAEA